MPKRDAATALGLPEAQDMWHLGDLPGGQLSTAELGVPISDGAAAAGVAGAAQEQGQNSFSGQSDGAAGMGAAAAGAGWAAVAAAQELVRQQGYTVSRDSAAVEAAAAGAAEEEKRSKLRKKVLEQERWMRARPTTSSK
jgi:hypothetical protein